MDQSIIREAILGNNKAFKKIFDTFLPKMRPVALRYVHTVFEADDVLQESFVKIYQHLKNFKHEGSFEGWIRRIVVNTALNHYKKNNKYYAFEKIEAVHEDQVQADEEIAGLEPLQLLGFIQELPPGYKMVFNLYVLDDLSHKEIAELLDISEGTSRSQYSKAKNMLKIKMSRQQNDHKSSLLKEGNKNGR